jgi:hypothetical protein
MTDNKSIREPRKHERNESTQISLFFVLFLSFALSWFALFTTGCTKPQPVYDEKEYLIRVGGSVLTVFEFKNSFDVALTAYPHDVMKNPDAAREIRLQLLKEASERLLLTERARELQLAVSDKELEAAIADIKEGYPEGAFEDVLAESAINYDSWKNELKARLLMQKVVANELSGTPSVSADEIAKYREAHKSDKTSAEGSADEAAAKHLSMAKTEDAYQTWIKQLQQKYPIEINEAQWKKIIGSKH